MLHHLSKLDKLQIAHTFFAYLTIAIAIGCSLLFSAVALMANSLRREHVVCSTNITILETRGTPWVTVPVLSNTMLLIW